MLRSDDREDALEATAECLDKRVTHFWDADKLTSEAFWDPLQLKTPAWDVYLLYDRAVTWQEGVPVPAFWMSQLGQNDPVGLPLDESALVSEVEQMIRQ